MTQSIIIGIHGLNNKPAKDRLESWWVEAIAEGLRRNHNLSLRPPFALAYWADLRPDAVTELDLQYEPVDGQGSFPRFNPSVFDKLRAEFRKWGGSLLDKEKQLFGLGTHVDKLLGLKFDDLRLYYDNGEKRRKIRDRLAELITHHQDKRITGLTVLL